MNNKPHELAISVTKNDNFSDWYIQMITKGKFIEYTDISGCYVLLPNSYGIWENIQVYINKHLNMMGVKNAYFPLFITERNLTKEKDHIEGFTPEVAWVTHAGNSKLEEKIAVRPTSECAMYPIFSNMIKSHNDLPLKLNQWCNVVRWEFKDCTPFLRSREFLWSETHSCFVTQDEAMKEVIESINLYEKTYKDLLAIPVVKGKKTESEKFAGALCTYTIEAFIPLTGKGIQAATSHCLGQNFSKMFNITYDEDKNKDKNYVWQNSWGFTTRSIGIMLMNHGDDKGAILPPFVAPIQIVIVPIPIKKRTDDVLNKSKELFNMLKTKYRVELDTTNYNPGYKFNKWEIQGVPLRIEIGPRDCDENTLTLSKRTDFTKTVSPNDSTIFNVIDSLLQTIHNELYDRAEQNLLRSLSTPQNKEEFGMNLDDKCLCYINWCGSDACETNIKETYKAKSLCIPTTFNELLGDNCCICNEAKMSSVLFGRSY
jgi:prolyl-tRNA synthetase